MITDGYDPHDEPTAPDIGEPLETQEYPDPDPLPPLVPPNDDEEWPEVDEWRPEPRTAFIDLDDPEAQAVIDETANLKLDPPNGEKYFVVRNGKAGAGKTVHLVDRNHVTKVYRSWTEKGTPYKNREFKFLTVAEVELLLDTGFTRCKVCGDRARRDHKLSQLDPLLAQFEDLAETAANEGVEVRLYAYDISSGTPRKPRELWSSMGMVRNQARGPEVD